APQRHTALPSSQASSFWLFSCSPLHPSYFLCSQSGGQLNSPAADGSAIGGTTPGARKVGEFSSYTREARPGCPTSRLSCFLGYRIVSFRTTCRIGNQCP